MGMKRQQWIDIAKGLAIFMVVIGHAQVMLIDENMPSANYFQWFLMPAFFVISGYLFKPSSNWQVYKSRAAEKSLQLLVPYLSFLIIITAVRYFPLLLDNTLTLEFVVKDMLRVGFGGRFIGGPYGAFWFITCFWASFCILDYIFLKQKNTRKRLIIIACMYIAAHIEAYVGLQHTIYIPWNVDVAMITVSYMAVGYYCRQYIQNMSVRTTILLLVLSAVFMIADYIGLMHYRTDFKNMLYNNVLLDLLIPVTLSAALLGISQLLEKVSLGRLIGNLGEYTLPVMYLHIPFNIFLNTNDAGLFVLIGVTIPWLAAKYVFSKFSLTRFIFLGIRHKSPYLAAKEPSFRS